MRTLTTTVDEEVLKIANKALMDNTGGERGLGVGVSLPLKMKSLINNILKIMTRNKKGVVGGGGGVDADIDIDSIRKVIKESGEFIIKGKIVRLVEGCVGGGGGVVSAGRITCGEMSNGDNNSTDDGNGRVRDGGAKKSTVNVNDNDNKCERLTTSPKAKMAEDKEEEG